MKSQLLIQFNAADFYIFDRQIQILGKFDSVMDCEKAFYSV